MKMLGSVVLTLAGLLLLSGLWCVFLSPIAGPSDDLNPPNLAWTRRFEEQTFHPGGTVSYNFSVEANQWVRVRISNIVCTIKPCRVTIYDPGGGIIFQARDDFHTGPIDFQSRKTGQYTIKIDNTDTDHDTYLAVEVKGFYETRPLAPMGQLLILLSLPLYALGTWLAIHKASLKPSQHNVS